MNLLPTNRGQIVGQIFIYILATIVVGMVLLLGVNALRHLEAGKCTVQSTQFATDLSASIEKNKGWGISRYERFSLPCNSQAVCFVSRVSTERHSFSQDTADTAPEIAAAVAEARVKYPLITSSIESGDNTNVFIKTDKGYERLERFEVAAPISLPESVPVRCIAGDGTVEILFNGLGQTVEVVDAS